MITVEDLLDWTFHPNKQSCYYVADSEIVKGAAPSFEYCLVSRPFHVTAGLLILPSRDTHHCNDAASAIEHPNDG